MSYLNATKDGTSHRFSLGSASDTTSGLFPAVKTHNTANGNFSGLLSNVTLYAGRTYYVKVKFRTRGDGNSTSSKCSSVGFIAWWNNWASARSYIHYPATAYAEIGKIVEWTYSFTVDSDVTPQGTELFFIIDNAWANGNDAQTIDLYYYKYWDSEGNIYNMSAWGDNLLDGKKWSDGTSILTEKTIETSGSYTFKSEPLPTMLFANNDRFVVEFELYNNYSDSFILSLKNGDDYGLYGNTTLYQGSIGRRGSGYRKYYIAIKIADFQSNFNNIRLMFTSITNGNVGFGVKSVKMYRYDRFFSQDDDEIINFLKCTKNNLTYYAKTYGSGRIKMTKDSSINYLREGANCYKYSELTSYTYGTLTDNFEY